MTPTYSAPALEKALDILELLAESDSPLSQSGIAESLDRSVGEIFRVLQTLERRAYVLRDPASGLYTLSLRLFDLAHRHAPLRGLVQAALHPMRNLAAEIQQSCNLAVLDGYECRVVAQVESPADFGFHVRVGAAFPLTSTATGATLMAFAADEVRNAWESGVPGSAPTKHFRELMDRARSDGYVEIDDALRPGIVDVAFPIFGAHQTAVAALTVPYVATSFSKVDGVSARSRTAAAAQELSRRLQALPADQGRRG
ncbi:MAG: IclR family transcriptional regulator [Glaciihabitans sp.]|nr:IclR family transcriptional regulator [Glaciihabitans sp.]